MTAVQRAFRLHFGLKRHDFIPTRNTILLWVANFRATGSTLKRKSIGRPRTARTPTNVDAVNASIQQSPKRSVRKHALSLAMSKSSMHRILCKDLKLHPYKMVSVQELSERDYENRRLLCLEIQQQVSRDDLDPVALKLATHNKIVFRVGMESCLLSPKCRRNALCTAVTDSLFLK